MNGALVDAAESAPSASPLLPAGKTAPQSAAGVPLSPAPRPAWIEIDLAQLKRNFDLIWRAKPQGLQLLSVVKDDGYGHGAFQVAKVALQTGASFLAVSTLHDALVLRERGIRARILLLGEREEQELPWCLAHDLTCCLSRPESFWSLNNLAECAGKRIPVHIKINTGMNRFGMRWDEVAGVAKHIGQCPFLVLEGALSHFAQSDESDKKFAYVQLARFRQALDQLQGQGFGVKVRHLCNSGGFLDLPDAHYDMVRLGILPLGVFPSAVCRRIPGIRPVMAVKARIAAIQNLQPGDTVGYGMRFTAATARRIAVLPLGYGDGFPRVRNCGFALVHGVRAPIVGGVTMDALTVDITDIPSARLWDEAVLMGRQGEEEISAHELAALKNSVAYDALTSWRSRLPRLYLHPEVLEET